MTLGEGAFHYRVIEGWGLGPHGHDHSGMITGVAVDAYDRVYAFRRTPRAQVLVYDRAGRFLAAWGDGIFSEPHAIWVDDGGRVYCADREDHTVRQFSGAGELLCVMGTPHRPGRPGMPFNKPTKAVTSPDGGVWVADGYGQARIHHFASDGRLLLSWGEAGQGTGQFNLPHSLVVDSQGRIIVVDRENHRLQRLDASGACLGVWPGFHQPMDICLDSEGAIYVAEAPQRISILSMHGQLLARWGEQGHEPGQFRSFLHGICVDSRGDLYVADEGRFQKFERVRSASD